MIKLIAYVVFLLGVLGDCGPKYDGEEGFITDDCTRCISEVVGGANHMHCSETGACGPFSVIYNHWKSVFPHEGNTMVQEFEQCTKNAWCAKVTVRKHMQQFLPNCVSRSGSRLVCETALALHRLGAVRCNNTLSADDKSKLYQCLHRRTMIWLNLVDGY